MNPSPCAVDGGDVHMTAAASAGTPARPATSEFGVDPAGRCPTALKQTIDRRRAGPRVSNNRPGTNDGEPLPGRRR